MTGSRPSHPPTLTRMSDLHRKGHGSHFREFQLRPLELGSKRPGREPKATGPANGNQMSQRKVERSFLFPVRKHTREEVVLDTLNIICYFSSIFTAMSGPCKILEWCLFSSSEFYDICVTSCD